MLRWQTRKYQSISGDVTGILWDYIAGITLHDVVAFYRIQKTLRACKKETMQLYTFAGEIDMEIAIASFRKSLPQWCCPSLQSDGAISVEKIRHPLMADAIPNDFVLKKGVVLTGANASGKSTFMKAVAINVILAQTINTCVAKNMKMPAIQVMTSMALRDDVLQGESYYMREIKYLKRMLDELETGEPMLFVIDEILKGTNTRERLAASNAILFFTRIRLPELITNTISSVGNMIGPASMIVTGMLFAGMDLKAIFANKRVYFISALRMLVIPLIALFLIKISHLATLSADAQKIMLIVFLAVITPSASTVTQMCQVYGNDAHYASAINVVTTLCAIVTMPFMVLLFSCI